MRPPAKLALLVAVALLLAACGGGGEAPTADGATAEETVATSPSPADSPAEAATAGAARFRSKAAFARWNGTAPIPVWSGNDTRHRLNRGGNRQVNAALHRIALTQWRGVGPGRAYVQHRLGAGSTKTEALRLLRRRLSDEVFRRLLSDETLTGSTPVGEEVIAA